MPGARAGGGSTSRDALAVCLTRSWKLTKTLASVINQLITLRCNSQDESLPRISRFHGGAHLKMHSQTFCENTDFLGIRIDFGYWAKDSNFKTPLNWFILHFHNFHMITEKSYSMTFRHCVGMPEFLHLGHFRCFRWIRLRQILVGHIPATDHIPITLHSKSLS